MLRAASREQCTPGEPYTQILTLTPTYLRLQAGGVRDQDAGELDGRLPQVRQQRDHLHRVRACM